MSSTTENMTQTTHEPLAEAQPPEATAVNDTIDAELAALHGTVADLQAEISTLKTQNTELSDQHLRSKAEAENARRRADDEVVKVRKFALESFAESLLPVLDSLEAGLAVNEATIEQIRAGADATLQQLKSALARNKVLAIAPEAGTKFDPHMHQAISMAAAEQEPNTVVTVLQKGYQIADRILRPALVTVTAPK
jgi:molecular chaperone GrpE